MPTLDTIRTSTLRFRTEGAQQARSELDSVADAEERRARAATGTATAVETSARRQLSAGQALDRLNKQIDADYRMQESLRRASGTIGRAANQGLIDQAESARLMDLATVRYAPKTPAGTNDNEPGRRGFSTRDRLFYQYQAFDAVSQASSGASLATVALQQGSQSLQFAADRDGGLKQGIKDLGSGLLGLVTPATVAGAAVVGLGVAIAVAAKQAGDDQQKLQAATLGLGRGTGATAGQLNEIAMRNTDPRLSTNSARDITAALASTGQISTTVFDVLISKATDFAKLTGQDIPAAAAMLAQAFSDPARGADDLASKIGGLDDKTRQLIQTQQEQGDKTGAQTTLSAYLKAQVDANTAATSGWASAWLTVSSAADKAWESLKRAVSVGGGGGTESAQQAIDRLQARLTDRSRLMNDPMGFEAEGIQSALAAARKRLADEQAETARRAAEEQADKASRLAGDTARAIDPNYARYHDLVDQQTKLRDALSDPVARGKLSDLGQVEDAYTSVTRAITTMTDASGKLLSAEEMSRRGDALKVAALTARTDAQKADIAAQQRAYDLIGKALTPSDARGQIQRAGQLSLLEAASKAGKSGDDSRDDFDRAVRSAEDRTRRQMEENQTLGMGADAVARYRTQTELLTAAKRAERDITPELSAQIQGYSDKAAAAADQQTKLRGAIAAMDGVRSTGKDVFGSIFSDISKGTTAATTFENALSRIESRMLDLASTSLTDALFGKTGSSGTGLLGSLFGGTGGMGSSIASFFGFASGGFTGSGGRHEPAGIVHRGEYVFDAAATSRIGVGALEAMRGGLPGYANGGPVGGYGARPAMPMMPANGNGGPPVVNVINNGEPMQARVEQREDGSLDVFLDKLEARSAARISRGLGPLGAAVAGGRRLRG